MDVRKLAAGEYQVYLKSNLLQEPPVYEPTKVTPSKLNEIFHSMNPNFKRKSECSDRAHVWAWDEYQKSGIKSEKVFIFFTASYINRVRFKWWFHVAPMFTLTNGQKMVTDVMYKDRPVTVKEWADMMIYNHRDCKVTKKFSEYDIDPLTEDCYLIFESMYYHLPEDIHHQELRGVYKTEWNEGIVSGARSRAFHPGRIQ